jgi:hypothetical protein
MPRQTESKPGQRSGCSWRPKSGARDGCTSSPSACFFYMFTCTIDSQFSEVRLFTLRINHRNFCLFNSSLYCYIGINYSLIPLTVIIMILKIMHCLYSFMLLTGFLIYYTQFFINKCQPPCQFPKYSSTV